MVGMHYLRVIMLKKLKGMVPVPYPIKNRVKIVDFLTLYSTKFVVFNYINYFNEMNFQI